MRRAVLALWVAGLAVRLATLLIPHAYFPDEVFQYLEPAHRLLFGRGIVTWEYRERIRSWLLPLLIAGPMGLGAAAAPGTAAYLLLPKAMAALASLALPLAIAALGRRMSPLHALYGLLVGLYWYEFVYFSTQLLTEAVAVPCIMAGAALLYLRRPLPAGALLALGMVLRFQYGPAVVAIAVGAAWSERRTLLRPLVAGAVPVFAAAALCDIAMGDLPYRWVMSNLHQNIILGRSHVWVEAPAFYPRAIAATWGFWLVPLLALAALGARTYPALMSGALVNLGAHSILAHKECRYILLSTAIFVALAAFGSADLVRWARSRSSADGRALPWIVGAAWLVATTSIAKGAEAGSWWTRRQTELQAFADLRTSPALCGVAVAGVEWSGTGGYAYLHRDVPLFVYDSRTALLRDARQFDAVMAPAGTSLAPSFREQRCFAAGADGHPICIYRRASRCAPARSPHEINRLLVRLDQ